MKGDIVKRQSSKIVTSALVQVWGRSVGRSAGIQPIPDQRTRAPYATQAAFTNLLLHESGVETNDWGTQPAWMCQDCMSQGCVDGCRQVCHSPPPVK